MSCTTYSTTYCTTYSTTHCTTYSTTHCTNCGTINTYCTSYSTNILYCTTCRSTYSTTASFNAAGTPAAERRCFVSSLTQTRAAAGTRAGYSCFTLWMSGQQHQTLQNKHLRRRQRNRTKRHLRIKGAGALSQIFVNYCHSALHLYYLEF